MIYEEIVNFLYTRLPVFHHQGKAAYKANLNNITVLCEAIGNPHKDLRTIHVAGTNGKGSVSHMLASVLQHAGYKTGLYTSPHLLDFRERMRINGNVISQDAVIQFVENNLKIIELLQPSFFEVTTAMAFDYFSKQQTDIAVIETGLGGRLDSTNIISPMLSVITNISIDHVDILGNTLEKIAYEKAGIIKPKVPVVIGESHKCSAPIFTEKAAEVSSSIVFAETCYEAKAIISSELTKQSFVVKKIQSEEVFDFTLDLLGDYQSKNIQTVLTCIDSLNSAEIAIREADIKIGLSNAAKTTGLMGRWQILKNKPMVIADTGHNEAGILFNMNQLSKIKNGQLHIVFGMVNDKDIRKVLSLLPSNAHYYFTKASVMRAMNETDLQNLALEYQLQGKCFATVYEAIEQALKAAQSNDTIFIGGSTFVVAEALPYFEI